MINQIKKLRREIRNLQSQLYRRNVKLKKAKLKKAK